MIPVLSGLVGSELVFSMHDFHSSGARILYSLLAAEESDFLINPLAVTGITPRSGWAVDPFGHSATMPYLLKRANITSMLIQRIHYSIKKHFASTRNLEFMWRQAWGEWSRASSAI